MNRKVVFAIRSALGLSFVMPLALQAQTAAAPATDTGPIEEVVVTGIRHSLEESLQLKKKADAIVDVVSAEDIGKMPDKNIADSLQRVPGLTISSAGANEGGFDENDRVSMRGTNPSLTQTLINGHNIAAGDWFVLDQTGQVGRSVSYTLLPSELVSKIVVHKSSEADLVEGGVAGSIDIITRKPLDDFSKPFSFEASAGAVYADLPAKADPQFQGLINWQNDGRTFGVLLQGFFERRHLQRDGIEELGYESILPGSAIATAHPDLANVAYPLEIGEAFFTQERTRTGGLFDVEFKPNDNLSFDLNGLYSDLEAPNFNRNYMLWATHILGAGSGQAPNAGYQVVNGTLESATFSGVPGAFYGVYDQISRPNESELASYINLDVNFRVSDRLSFLAQTGISRGEGKTPTQDVSEMVFGQGNGASYTLHGVSSAPSFSFGATDNTTPTPASGPVGFGWIFGAENVDVVDQENWAKLDGTFKAEAGPLLDVKFGARWENHERESVGAVAQGPLAPSEDPANWPATHSTYPSFPFSGVPTGIWYWTPAQLAAYNSPTNVNRDPTTRAYIADGWYAVHEKNYAVYGQLDFGGDKWSANLGLRWVQTVENTSNYMGQDGSVTPQTPGAVVGSAFGPYVIEPDNHTYNDVLPSANFKFNFSPDLLMRAAIAKTMTRADYSDLAANYSIGAPPGPGALGNGSGGNPDLKPIVSTNFDLGVEYYFARRSLLSATAFYMDLNNYVGYGSKLVNVVSYSLQFPQGQILPYDLTVPVNTKGRVAGVELAYEQAITDHIGVAANYTRADGKQTSGVLPNADGSPGDSRLVGTSKNTYNINAYYEDSHFSVRVAYNYRSAFYSGLDRSTAFTQDSIGYLSASLAYIINQNFSVTLDGQNLNNPELKYYALNTAQPRAFYFNGRQYFLNFRAKF
jgi:iron complex outermembrane receptor protein